MGTGNRLEPGMCLHVLLCTAYLSACAAASGPHRLPEGEAPPHRFSAESQRAGAGVGLRPTPGSAEGLNPGFAEGLRAGAGGGGGPRAGGREAWRGFLEGLARAQEGPQPQPPLGASWAPGGPNPWMHPRTVLLEGLKLAEGAADPKSLGHGTSQAGQAVSMRVVGPANPDAVERGSPKKGSPVESAARQSANPKAAGLGNGTDEGRTGRKEDARTWLSTACSWIEHASWRISNAATWIANAAMSSSFKPNEGLTRREMRERQAPIPLPEYWRSRRKGTPGRPWPSIFMYRLPGAFKNSSRFWEPNYGAEEALPIVLKEMGHVVEDPEDADLYYLDAWFYSSFLTLQEGERARCKGRPRSCVVLSALEFIRYNYPYFERSAGVDHIWPLTYDHGFCGFSGWGDMALTEIRLGIIAEHWGYDKPEFFCLPMERYQEGRCYDRFHREGRREPRLPCYVKEKDVLMPSSYVDQSPAHGGDRSTVLRPPVGPISVLPPDQDASRPDDTGQTLHCATPQAIIASELTVHMFPNRPRNLTLFFAGSSNPESPIYSHGVRQSLYSMFAVNMQPPGFRLVNGSVPDMLQELTQARFTLAATGAGFGLRMKLALLCGSIPVIIADDVAFENNDVFDLRDISIRIPERYTYMLPEVLAYLEEHHKDTVEVMQRRIACAWRYWVWTLPYGRAGEAFVCSLRRKLVGHQALLPRMDWDSCTLHC
eukprot:jgi/Botrbrau1/19675/Bobra.0003s0037.1